MKRERGFAFAACTGWLEDGRHVEGISFHPSFHRSPAAMILGLRTVIYPAPDLARVKAWYSQVLGVQPYFAEPSFDAAAVRQAGRRSQGRSHRALANRLAPRVGLGILEGGWCPVPSK